MIELRAWSVADGPALHAAAVGDPELAKQFGGEILTDPGAATDFVVTHLVPRDASAHNFAIAVDGVAVGNVGINRVERRHDTAWSYYWLAAGHRGQGLAVRGLATLAGWALDELGLFRLELAHRVNNPASCRVATRAGFVAEGIERKKLRYGAERYDVEVHARLATDPRPTVPSLPLRVDTTS